MDAAEPFHPFALLRPFNKALSGHHFFVNHIIILLPLNTVKKTSLSHGHAACEAYELRRIPIE